MSSRLWSGFDLIRIFSTSVSPMQHYVSCFVLLETFLQGQHPPRHGGWQNSGKVAWKAGSTPSGLGLAEVGGGLSDFTVVELPHESEAPLSLQVSYKVSLLNFLARPGGMFKSANC